MVAFALATALLAIQAAPSASTSPFTIVFAPGDSRRTLPADGERVLAAVAAALRANPDASLIVLSRGWGGFEGISIAQCHVALVARRRLIALGIDPARIALRGPRHMAWERAPRDTLEEPRQPQLDFRLGHASEAANVRAMPDSCLSRLRP